MRRSLSVLVAVLAGLTFSACFIVVEHGSTTSRHGSSWSSGPEHIGSGVAAHETRTLPAFTEIKGGGTVAFDIRLGSPASLTVHGDDNLLSHVRTEVKNGLLEVSMDPGSYAMKNDLRVEIVTPSLKSCTMGGASETRIEGLDGHDLSLAVHGTRRVTASGQVAALDAQVTGAAELDAAELRARELALDMSGTARVSTIAAQMDKAKLSGATDAQVRGLESGETSVSLSGTSKLTLEGRVEGLVASLSGATGLHSGSLHVQRARVDLSGTSQATVHVTENLEAAVSGAAHLKYAGQPVRLNTRASGTGSVKALP